MLHVLVALAQITGTGGVYYGLNLPPTCSRGDVFSSISLGVVANCTAKDVWTVKQDVLVSGTNIKTINGASVLGSGDLTVSGSGAAWGSVTGTLADQTDLQTALNGKQAAGAYGYMLHVQALTSSPADGATIYFGQLPKAPVTAQGNSRIYIRKAGTIKIANILNFSGTAGTNEAWTCHIRLNNTGDTAIATVSAATNERVWFNGALNLAVTASDYIEIKCVNPTWVTNPLTSIFGGYLYVE